MSTGWASAALERASRLLSRPAVLGALGVLTIASVVYSQFDLYGKFSRDSAIYVYGGQRLTHGVPPYASEMDPKGPVSSILCGFGVAVARLLGRDDVLVVRVEFCALAIVSVLGLYLLVLELFRSVTAGFVAGAVFVWFRCYAHQALIGPEGHEPGIVFLIFAMWLSVRRQWYLAGAAASLAFCSWQPLFAYPVFVVICAAVWSDGQRLRSTTRALAGIVTPLLALVVYYAVGGYLRWLFEGLFVFPLLSVHRHATSFGERATFIVRNIDNSFQSSAVFLWAGLVLLLGMAAWTVVAARPQWRAVLLSPMILLIVGTFVVQAAYVLYDYIGWTHAFPLLPYSAIGFGAATSLLLERVSAPRAKRITTATLVTAVAVTSIVYAVAYYMPSSNDSPLRSEEASACAIRKTLVPRTPLWSLGDPIPLVLLHLRNPDNYPYEGSGLDVWKVEHTKGGFRGWTGEIKASGASVVVLDSWKGPYRGRMRFWLSRHGYQAGYIGPFRVYVTSAARARMAAAAIALAKDEGLWPLKTDGTVSRVTHCTTVAAG